MERGANMAQAGAGADDMTVVSMSALFAQAVVSCVADARPPTDAERADVAQRIWSDGFATRTATDWDDLPATSHARLSVMRAADAALCGTS